MKKLLTIQDEKPGAYWQKEKKQEKGQQKLECGGQKEENQFLYTFNSILQTKFIFLV